MINKFSFQLHAPPEPLELDSVENTKAHTQSSPLKRIWHYMQGHKDADAPTPISSSHTAHIIYEIAVQQSRHSYFYTQCLVPDSVDGRFDMIAMHLFIVLERLRKTNQGYQLMEDIMTIFVDDMDRSLREMGIGDLSVGRKVKVMVEALHGRLDAYRTAFGEGVDAVSAAIARNVYRGVRVKPAAISSLISYFYRQADHLSMQSDQFLLAGTVNFKQPFESVVL